eukprot:4277410-Amphidinium_carterae.1
MATKTTIRTSTKDHSKKSNGTDDNNNKNDHEKQFTLQSPYQKALIKSDQENTHLLWMVDLAYSPSKKMYREVRPETPSLEGLAETKP